MLLLVRRFFFLVEKLIGQSLVRWSSLQIPSANFSTSKNLRVSVFLFFFIIRMGVSKFSVLVFLLSVRLMAPYISSGIFWEILKQWAKGAKVIVVDIPLLFETKMDRWTKPVVVVWVSQETQLNRLMERDGLSEEDARNRAMAQMSLDSKRSKADIVIDNNGGLDQLHQQFDKVLSEIRRPLTWIEFWRSRQGAFSILGLVTSGLLVCKQLN